MLTVLTTNIYLYNYTWPPVLSMHSSREFQPNNLKYSCVFSSIIIHIYLVLLCFIARDEVFTFYYCTFSSELIFLLFGNYAFYDFFCLPVIHISALHVFSLVFYPFPFYMTAPFVSHYCIFKRNYASFLLFLLIIWYFFCVTTPRLCWIIMHFSYYFYSPD